MREDTQQDNNLVRRLAGLTEAEKNEYDELLKRLLPELNSWRIELSRGQSFVEYETHAGACHAADLFGDGMASLFRVALCIIDSSPGTIVAIDEPELSLHPQAQKSLAAVLAEVATDRQVLISTHSPYFISWSDVSNGAAVYRLTQEREGVRVGKLSDDTFEMLQRLVADWQKPHFLDAVAREVFFADEVVFFEGQEDVALVRNFAEDKRLPSPAAFGYGAGGSGNIKHFLRMAQDLEIPAVAIYDGDKANEKEEVEKEFPDAMIELLPTEDIRDKPKKDESGNDSDEIEKEGIFDRHGVVKTEHTKYLSGLLNRFRHFFDEQPESDEAAE